MQREYELDRLGRPVAELAHIVDDLKVRGIGLNVLTSEGAAIDATRPEGQSIFGAFAAFTSPTSPL